MKTRKIAAITTLLLGIALICGCNATGKLLSGIGNKLTTPVYTVTPPTVIGTNVVSVSASTNQAGVVIPPHTEYVPLYSAPVTNVTYVASQGAQNVLTTGETVSSIVPPPYGTIGTLVFGGLSGLLMFYLKIKNKKLIEAQDVADLVNPLIAGIEAGNHGPTKVAVQNAAAAAGVQPELDVKVQEVSARMPEIK